MLGAVEVGAVEDGGLEDGIRGVLVACGGWVGRCCGFDDRGGGGCCGAGEGGGGSLRYYDPCCERWEEYKEREGQM